MGLSDSVDAMKRIWDAEDQTRAFERALAAAKREGAADLVFQLGLATGHADTMEDLVEHVREQLEEMRGNAKREGVEEAVARVEYLSRIILEARIKDWPEHQTLPERLRALAKEMEG